MNLSRNTYCQMVNMLTLIPLVSLLLRFSSIRLLLRMVKKPPVSNKCATNLFKSLSLIFVEIFIVTSSFPVVLLFMRVYQTGLRWNLMLFVHKAIWLKLLLRRIVTYLYGVVVLSSHLFLCSNHNGLPNKNMKKTVLKSSIESAFEKFWSLSNNSRVHN